MLLRVLKRLSILFAILVILASFKSLAADSVRCESLFSDTHSNIPFRELPVQISQLYEQETKDLSVEEIKSLNNQVVQKLENYKPAPRPHSDRATAAPIEEVKKLLSIVKKNPVVGLEAEKIYEQAETSIGYCFGRATYAHLMLLKMGLQKDSIFKIWAYGEMHVPTFPVWQFHVATVAYTAEKGWVVIDTRFPFPISVKTWMMSYSMVSSDQKLRFYITPAEKFSIDIGKYNRVQMGFTLSKEEDWYKHYFVDLIGSIKNSSLEDLGLQKLSYAESELNEPYFAKIFAGLKSLFKF